MGKALEKQSEMGGERAEEQVERFQKEMHLKWSKDIFYFQGLHVFSVCKPGAEDCEWDKNKILGVSGLD